MRLRTAAALAGIVLISACSGGSKPQVLPSLTPTPSTSAVPVFVPPAAKVHDAFGAAAFVRFYYAQVNSAYQAGNPDLLAGLGDPECGTCKSFMASVAELGAKGQRVVGVVVRVLSAEASPEQNGGIAVDVQADAPPRTVVDASGKIVQRLPADPRYHLTVFVKDVPAGWVVRAVRKTTT